MTNPAGEWELQLSQNLCVAVLARALSHHLEEVLDLHVLELVGARRLGALLAYHSYAG